MLTFLATGIHANDFSEMSLEDLLQVPVRSAAKKQQPLFDAPTAITILDEKFLENSPFTQLPDLLRYVPGMLVTRGNASISGVTARGFNNRYANKLLVLVDGRSIYNQAYSGVFWEANPFFLDDLSRIEVIRGPGGTLWGANAVNGVVNISSKPSWETQGWKASIAAGLQTEYSTGLRYGGAVGERLTYRVSALAESFEGGEFAPRPEFDAWETFALRGRLDYEFRSDRFLTVHADAYRVETGESVVLGDLLTLEQLRNFDQTEYEGQSLTVKWEQLGDEETISYHVQTYVENSSFDTLVAREERTTFDVELLARQTWGAHEISLGLGYRVSDDEWAQDRDLKLADYERSSHIAHGLLQGVFKVSDPLSITAGAKIEHHGWGIGWAFQPNLRAVYRLSERQRLWAAISRAARTPSRLELDSSPAVVGVIGLPVPPGIPAPDRLGIYFSGNRELDPEYLNAFEVGYRIEGAERWSFEITGFLHHYEALTGGVILEPEFQIPPVPHLAVQIPMRNRQNGRSYGVELSARWVLSAEMDWTLNYTYLSTEQWTLSGFESYSLPNTGQGTGVDFLGSEAPDHTVSFVANWSPAERLKIFAAVRWNSAIPSKQDTLARNLELDLAVHYQISEHFRFSLNGTHLMRSSRTEYSFGSAELATSTPLDRGLDARVEYEF